MQRVNFTLLFLCSFNKYRKKEARKDLIKEAAKLGIRLQDMRFSSYPLEGMRRADTLMKLAMALDCKMDDIL